MGRTLETSLRGLWRCASGFSIPSAALGLQRTTPGRRIDHDNDNSGGMHPAFRFAGGAEAHFPEFIARFLFRQHREQEWPHGGIANRICALAFVKPSLVSPQEIIC